MTKQKISLYLQAVNKYGQISPVKYTMEIMPGIWQVRLYLWFNTKDHSTHTVFNVIESISMN